MSSPDDEHKDFDRWQHLDRCLAEYRFQVELNWKRTQYFFALNLAVLAAATGLLSSAGDSQCVAVAALFLIGIALSGFAVIAGRIQKGYYQEARDLLKRVQADLGLADLAIRTTPGLGSSRPRWQSVGVLQEWMFGLIALADLTGLVVSIT